jgi:Mrp family chromosome partitioning ATPase
MSSRRGSWNALVTSVPWAFRKVAARDDQESARSLPAADVGEPGLAVLLERLRTMVPERPVVVVLAAASPGVAISRLARRLADEAWRQGARARVLAPVDGIELRDQMAAEGEPDDLVVVEGPPLSDSHDAVLLARSCDGLVIVGVAGVTERTALVAAAERTRVPGSRALGVVIMQPDDRPAWLRWLLRVGQG